MIVLLDKKISPLCVKFKVLNNYKNEPVLFLWEDSLSKNIKFLDKMSLSKDTEYFSNLNKNIDFFENGITFKVVNLKNYETIFSYDFKNLNFIQGNNVLYISQNSYTGYSYAARNYIYQLIENGFNVKWDTRFSEKNIYSPITEEEKKVFNCKNNDIDIDVIDSVIIHHTPESWLPIYKSLPKNIKVYGLTTWETTRLHSNWVNYINEGVDEVIVPSQFNIETFKNSGINKKLNRWYHDIFPFVKSNVNLKDLFDKFLTYKSGSFVKDWFNTKTIIDNNTVYYNISQFTNRKNVTQLIDCFCKKFTKKHNVCLFLKIYLENFNEKETDALKYKVHNILKNYIDIPNIIFCFENLNNEQISVIHEFGDVYFTLNRGEGFGLSTYTAKKIGNKIICGKFGAEKEFLDDSDLLLNYQLGPSRYLDDFNKFYIDDQQQCAFYDTDYVVSKLQYFPKTKKQLYNYS